MQNTRFPNLQKMMKKKKRMGDVVYSHTHVWLSCGIGCEPPDLLERDSKLC